jgi:carbamoyl-phosphate synthase small subunit
MYLAIGGLDHEIKDQLVRLATILDTRMAQGQAREAWLVLEDGSVFPGFAFGSPSAVSGEVVFNTGMVGYPETLTDPSYRGQILVLTYPLVGNYGVPASTRQNGLHFAFESEAIQVAGLVVAEAATMYSHRSATRSLGEWLTEQAVPGLSGVDTRALTKRLRERGVMLGKLVGAGDDVGLRDPNQENLVALVCIKEPATYGTGRRRVVLIDCGCQAEHHPGPRRPRADRRARSLEPRLPR